MSEDTIQMNDDNNLSSNEKQLAELIVDKQNKLIKSNENIIVNNFVGFFEPLIQNLDLNVQNLRLSQCELTNQIKSLLNQISKIYDDEKKKLDLDDYTKRLVIAKKRLNTIQATIISVQERLNRIYVTIQRDPHLKELKEKQAAAVN